MEPFTNHPGLLRAAELAEEAERVAMKMATQCEDEGEAARKHNRSIAAEMFGEFARGWLGCAAANRARAEQYRGLVRAAVEQHKETPNAV